MTSEKISVAILDDHPLILNALKQLVKKIPGVKSVVDFTTAEDFKEYISSTNPDIAILDMRINGKDMGVEMAKLILSKPKSKTQILMYTSHTDYYHIVDCLNIGVSGYVSKDSPISEIKIAINQIQLGQNYYSKDVQEIVEHYIKPKLQYVKSKDEFGNPSLMTLRELEILTLTCSGYAEEEMCEKLGVSPKTVRKHRQNIMQKLGCNKVHYLYQYAITKGLISF